jgi:hypothetical protein
MHVAKKLRLIIATSGCLAACAVTQGAGKVEHGINVVSSGESIGSEILVQYGDMRRKFCKRGCGKGSTSFYERSFFTLPLGKRPVNFNRIKTEK